MAEKVLTLEDVKEQFCTEDKRATLEAIRKRLDDVLDIDEAAELTVSIGEDMVKQMKAASADWPPLERMLWAVKEAFILGCLDMATKMMIANDMCYEALAGEEADT